EQRVSVIAIDEKSVEQLGSWPWPRENMGRLSAALNDYGVQLQLYDIVFPEAREGDAEFIAALSAGNAVLSQVPVLGSDQVVRTGALSHALTGVGCNAQDARSSSFIANNQAFASIPKGHIALNVDGDGAVRQVPAYVCVDGAAYPALALSAFINAAGGADWSAERVAGQDPSGPASLLHLGAYPGPSVPLAGNGNLRVSF